MPTYDVPPHLVDAILRGRCVAFVGAGFAMPVIPTWAELLVALGARLGHRVSLASDATAFDYEAIGQQLQDRAGDLATWETLVKDVLETCQRDRDPAALERLERRRAWLLCTPWKAVLTTNFDDSLVGDTTTPSTYWRILRGDARRGWQLPANLSDPLRRPPVIKLHGDANGDARRAPLVFGRADYRRLVHGESRYANFVRAVFAQYTVVFLGVSFTDAYLNELRSEVLSLLHTRDRAGPPWGYAVLVNKPREVVEFFRAHESIVALEADSFDGLDGWLEAIANKTSVRGRLRTLLAGKRVVWVDAAPVNNARGVELLVGCGAAVTQLLSADQLDAAAHGSADLMLTHFGYDPAGGPPCAGHVLDRTRTWSERPPVIVFASAAKRDDELGQRRVRDNRLYCVRRGAWEYTTHWSELYRLIELLFDRAPGVV